MRTNFGVAVLFLALSACAVDSSSRDQRSDVNGDSDECKIEGDNIGQPGATLNVHGTIVTFVEWYEKADAPGEYVGFRLSDNAAGLSYVVKTGTQTWSSSSLEWHHPDGDSGPNVHGISNVDFCDNEPCHDAGVEDPEDPEDQPTIP